MNWIAQAKRWPVAFAQVREDSLQDFELVNGFRRKVDVLMVASGGCTAALLATSHNVRRLHLVDPNPAQLALARFKLHLLRRYSTADRLRILGHSAFSAPKRAQKIHEIFSTLGIDPQALGPLEAVAKVGPDFCGRYEMLFARLRQELRSGTSMDRAFGSVMSLPNLKALFGAGATANRVQPFSRHFAERTQAMLNKSFARQSPYLAQMLDGRFRKTFVYPWLEAKSPTRYPNITWEMTMMKNALEKSREAFDFIHLSNILDWLSAAEAKATLNATHNALRKNGLVIVRQLNSNLNIPRLGNRFGWDERLGRSLSENDRSFFYRAIFVGRK